MQGFLHCISELLHRHFTFWFERIHEVIDRIELDFHGLKVRKRCEFWNLENLDLSEQKHIIEYEPFTFPGFENLS